MKMSHLVCVAALAWSAGAMAHTHLVKSDPADGSTLKAAPPRFVLTFAEPAKLTVLSLQKDSEPAKKIAPLPDSSSAEITVPAPQLTAGRYVLSWRALSSDGHVMPGKLTFTVSAGPSTTNAPGSTGP